MRPNRRKGGVHKSKQQQLMTCVSSVEHQDRHNTHQSPLEVRIDIPKPHTLNEANRTDWYWMKAVCVADVCYFLSTTTTTP